MLSHAQGQMPVEGVQGKIVRKTVVVPGPLFLRILQRLQARRPPRAQLVEEFQCVRKVRELVHQIDLGQKRVAHVLKLRSAAQPRGKLSSSFGGDLINDAPRAALGSCAPRAQQPLLLESLQARIDLAQFSSPEMPDAVVQDRFQVVAAGGLAKQPEQNVFQAHVVHYIMYYINVKRFVKRKTEFSEPQGNQISENLPACPHGSR
jgi:hypothetical protein